MKVISIINYKGGVGKSTVSTNLGAELAYRGNNVLLIDLDPQTNLTLSFMSVDDWKELESEGKTVKHWYDDYLDFDMESPLEKLICTPAIINQRLRQFHANGKVDVISSHLDLINVDMELSSRLGGNTERTIVSNYLRVLTRLKNALTELDGQYDFIVIDCPPNFNLVTQNAIVASDFYIIPAKADYLSTLGIDTLLRHIKQMTRKYNQYVQDSDREEWKTITPKMAGVIFTMIQTYSQKPISTQRDYMTRVKRLGVNSFSNYIKENKSLFGEAPESGVPVVLKEHDDPIIDDIEKLVTEITTQIRNQ